MSELRKPLNKVSCGEVAGSTTAKQLPDVACNMLRIQAAADNAGNVYLGGAGVTIPDGTADATSGIVLDAGVDTGWMSIDNLNKFYIICTNAGDDIVYLAIS